MPPRSKPKQQRKTKAKAKAPQRGQRPQHKYEMELKALQKKAERRERILADERRVAAKWRTKIPEVRKVNFENFKNRFQEVGEPDYAVDVLMAGPGLQAQIRRENGHRRREDLARIRQSYLGLGSENTAGRSKRADVADKSRREKRGDGVSAADSEIERIRIQSQPVLGHLTALLGDMEQRSTPRTFMRPFKALVYYQPKMREILATLEEKWADFEEVESETVNDSSADTEPEVVVAQDEADFGHEAEHDDGDDTNSDSDLDSDDSDMESVVSVDSNADDDFDNLMDSPEALRDMRCYVDFIDAEVMPLYQRFDGSSCTTVRFDDLWALFRVGDLIYMPASGETGGRYHEMWRIYRTRSPAAETAYPTSGWDLFADDMGNKNDDDAKFRVSAYYIDHDGSSFGAVRRKLEIEPFVGERLIESLEFFPVRFRPDHGRLLEALQAQGRQFCGYLDDRHQQYSAWTLTRNPPVDETEPDDDLLDNEDYSKMRHPEFVESDVIVDMTEAYQKMPGWRPSFCRPTIYRSSYCELHVDEMAVQQWFGGSRQTRAYAQTEVVQKADGVERRQSIDNLAVDAFLRSRVRGARIQEMQAQAQQLRDEDLVLLPKRMFAYALRERRFLPIDVTHLRPVRHEVGVFESLRIQREYKDVVRGLVMSHFQKKQLERRYADSAIEGPSQDLVQGKGRGLVVLLHGVPGVGKTATAEAVAMENRKPLFVITCGDLGLTPQGVESSLKNVFRLANLWDCVLLLDEADVFLSQRSKLDMKRNALVSVFLRVLEYYNGLLFLTTNRVGTIDEAFKSRIHLSLYYPPLDKVQTRDIFRLNISKLRDIEAERHRMTGEPALVIKDNEILDFATKHYEELARSTGCWNGRQIRSAFQIASSLALHNYTLQSDLARSRGQAPPAAPVLDRSLFDKVQMSTQSFDRHMKKEAGSYDTEMPLRGSFSAAE